MKKSIVLFLVIVLVGLTEANAQEKKNKLTRQEKKELRREKQEERIKIIEQALSDTLYVLEAEYLGNRKGQRVPVNSSINFVMVNKDMAVFQFGSAHTVGYNGVGGATVEGRITNYEVMQRKNGQSYFIRLTISSTLGFFDITLDIGASGNASATVHTNTRHKLNYSGKVVPRYESNIYKGMSR